MKAVRWTCKNCGSVNDIALESSFDDVDERELHRFRLLAKIFNLKRECSACGDEMALIGVVETN